MLYENLFLREPLLIAPLSSQEYDVQESHRVHDMFEHINSMLFEACDEASSTLSATTKYNKLLSSRQQFTSSNHLHVECGEWRCRFPHLRLLGKQIIAPQDCGFNLHPLAPTHGNASEDSLLQITASSDLLDSSSTKSNDSSFKRYVAGYFYC